jgi:uncharacterized protein YggE
MRKNKLWIIAALVAILSLTACTPALSAGIGLVNAAALPPGPLPELKPVNVETQSPSAQTPPMRTLNVTGTGTVYLTPDIATITIGVHNENADVSKAVSDNSANTMKVKDALVKFGVADKDIQTQNFSIYQNQKMDSMGQPKEMVYAVDNSLTVTVRDITKIGKLLGEMVRAGANNINGISFDVADKATALTDARKLALANAKKQADEMATALGATLGAVQSAVVNSTGYPGPMAYGMGGGGLEKAAALNVPISAGQLVITADITLIYEIK